MKVPCSDQDVQYRLLEDHRCSLARIMRVVNIPLGGFEWRYGLDIIPNNRSDLNSPYSLLRVIYQICYHIRLL